MNRLVCEGSFWDGLRKALCRHETGRGINPCLKPSPPTTSVIIRVEQIWSAKSWHSEAHIFFCYILSSLFMHSVHETNKKKNSNKTWIIYAFPLCQCGHQKCTGPIGLLTPQSALNFTSCFDWAVIMQRNVNAFGMFDFTHKNLFLTNCCVFMWSWHKQ